MDTRIKHSLEKIVETDEVILWRVSMVILGEHREFWVEEEKHP